MSYHFIKHEVHTRPVVPEDPNFVECAPEGRFSRLTDISQEFLTGLGVEHLIIDFDGSMVPYGRREIGVSPETLEWLQLVSSDPRIKSVNIATDGGGFDEIEDLDRWGGVRLNGIYQPWVAGDLGRITKVHPVFWRKILFKLECMETPERVVNIGDSPIHDIIPAQQAGLQAVLVDRLEPR